MKFIVRGKQTTVTPALQEYIERKVGHIDNWLPEDKREQTEARVLLAIEGQGALHKAEVTVAVGGLTLRGEVRSEDMYASIDAVVEKLERQIRKHKTKLDRAIRQRDKQRGMVRDVPEAATITADPDAEPFVIRRTKTVDLKPIDVEEAILQMNLLDHQFYLFLNRDTNDTELVYRRGDGTYGWLTR
ncbi:ribosome-associated translation inhibitor RaiA [Paenibacillus sp. TRM 82003]|nr:ribosome-associated translation inhibitor RaiA [Paenibacillus sp. TRM 82003]